MTRAPDRRRLALLTFSHVVDDVYQGAVPALLPFFVAERHYTYVAVTGLTLAANLLSSVLQPVFGALTDRFRLTWMVPAGLLTAAIGVGLSGALDTYALTWLAIAVAGVGVAAYHPEAARAAREASGGSQRAMSVYAVGGNLGLALGPALVVAVVPVTGLSGTPLMLLPALAAAALLAVVFARQRGGPATAGPSRLDPQRVRDDWAGFAKLTVVVVARSVFFFGVSSLLALYVAHGLGYGAHTGEAVLTVFLVTGAAGTLLGGWLADRVGRLPIVRVAYAVAVLSGLGLVLVDNLVSVVVLTAITALGVYLPFSIQVTLGQDYLPNRIGTASGVSLGLAITAGGLFAPLLGALADAASLRVAVAVLPALPLFACLVSLCMREPATAVPEAASSSLPP